MELIINCLKWNAEHVENYFIQLAYISGLSLAPSQLVLYAETYFDFVLNFYSKVRFLIKYVNLLNKICLSCFLLMVIEIPIGKFYLVVKKVLGKEKDFSKEHNPLCFNEIIYFLSSHGDHRPDVFTENRPWQFNPIVQIRSRPCYGQISKCLSFLNQFSLLVDLTTY
jgi:hypothetical protein